MARYEKIGRVSTESVHKGSGRHWDEWIRLLEKAGARAWTYTEITVYLKTKHKLSPWWQQGVALGFELATGKREEGQNSKGLYTVTATKSIPAEAAAIWKYLTSEKGLAHWLRPLFKVKIAAGAEFETEDGFFGEVRTLKAERRIRMTWQDPEWPKKTVVQVTLVPRPKKNPILVIDHSEIRDVRTREKMRARWRGVLDGLQLK